MITVVIMPVKGRFPLLKLTIKRLVKQGCIVICSGHTEKEKEVCESVGAIFLMCHEETPLGKKWQICADKAKEFNPDGILIMGSSDMVQDGWCDELYKAIDKGYAKAGTGGCYFLDIQKDKYEACYWGGYSDERKGESIGTGRLIGKKALELLDYHIFDEWLDNGLDYSTHKKLESIEHHFKGVSFNHKGLKCLSISTYAWENKHNYRNECESPTARMVDPEEVFKLFPELRHIEFDPLYSVVIPTMWKSDKINRMIEVYNNCELVDEVIIINNDVSKTFHFDSKKVKYIDQKENIFVNPAWNLGVKESKNDRVILANDDVIIERLTELLTKINESDFDLIGVNYNACLINEEIKLNPCNEMTWGYGCFMIFNKSIYKPINEELKIWFGDNIIFSNAKNPATFEGVFVNTKMGETINQGFKEKARAEIPVFEKLYPKAIKLKHEVIIPYSVNVGGYDFPRTDNILTFTDYDRFKSNDRNSRIYFILPHKFLDCDISVLISGEISITIPVERLVHEWLGDADMALFKHPWRDCVHDEIVAAECRIKSPDELKILREQGKYYRKIGVPEHLGLPETGIVIRRHNRKVIDFCNDWWAEMCRWSYRDQCSFSKVLLDHPDLKINYIEPDVRVHPYCKINGKHIPQKA